MMVWNLSSSFHSRTAPERSFLRICLERLCTPQAVWLCGVSDAAWRKRFSKAAPFLREILHSLLSALLPAADIPAFAGVKNVLQADASVIRLEEMQQEQSADAILHITPKSFCLYNADGKKISLTALLEEAEEKRLEWIDIFGFCKYKGKTGFVRVTAHKLPACQAEKARKLCIFTEAAGRWSFCLSASSRTFPSTP